jgi:hypothetical protein
MKTALKVGAALLLIAALAWMFWTEPAGGAQESTARADAGSTLAPSLSAPSLPGPASSSGEQRAAIAKEESAASAASDLAQKLGSPPAPAAPAVGRIFGRVYRPDGRPAAGRRVRMLQMSKGPEKYASCDEEGRYDERELEVGPWSLSTWPGDAELADLGLAEKDTIGGFVYMAQHTVDLVADAEVEVNLGMPPQDGVLVRGRVLDEGQPVRASLTWLPDGQDSMDRQQLCTASVAEGFEVLLNQAGRHVVVLIVGSTRIEQVVDVAKRSELEHDFVLPSARITGVVLDPAGQAAARARVALTPRAAHLPRHPSANLTYARTTNADGSFEFRNLPAARYSLVAHGELPAEQESGFAPLPALEIDLTQAARLENLELRLLAGSALRGMITRDAVPVANAHVFVLDERGEPLNPLSASTSDKQGAFQMIPLAAGRYRAIAAAGLSWSTPIPFEVPRPASEGPLELRLQACAHLDVDIQGCGEAWIDVRDAAGNCLSALFDKYSFSRIHNRDWSSTLFSYRLPPGEYSVRAIGAAGVLAQQTQVLKAGETVRADLSRR